MKCLLLALTGMGNAVLKSCWVLRDVVSDILVITRAETGRFPYYPCENLAELCANQGVKCLVGANLHSSDTLGVLRNFAPDITLAATFHQIVPRVVLGLAPLGTYNIHPSLLPAYKGPMPTNWAIIHGETQTGVTVHEMTPELDQGRVVLCRTMDIGLNCDGELRRRLAVMASEVAVELLRLAATGQVFLEEMRGVGSYHPRLLSPEGLHLIANGRFDLRNVERGVTPWPGLAALGSLIPGLWPGCMLKSLGSRKNLAKHGEWVKI